MQHDFFHVTRESPTSYTISLTISPTPLYRVEISSDPAAIADILLYKAFTTDPPVAGARLARTAPKVNKHLPVVSICTSTPASETASWGTSMVKPSSLRWAENLRTNMPVIMVPGYRPVIREFGWYIKKDLGYPDVELRLLDTIPLAPEGHDRARQFASYYQKANRLFGTNVLILRRGAGLEFQYATMVGLVAIIHFLNARK
jgi:hypothetical protein